MATLMQRIIVFLRDEPLDRETIMVIVITV